MYVRCVQIVNHPIKRVCRAPCVYTHVHVYVCSVTVCDASRQVCDAIVVIWDHTICDLPIVANLKCEQSVNRCV